MVDELPPGHDSDSTYIQNTNNVGPAIFGYNPLPQQGMGTITSVTVTVVAKRMYTSISYRNASYEFRGMMRINGVNYASSFANLAKNNSYNGYFFDFNVNPATGQPWTWEDILGGAATTSLNILEGFGVRSDTLPNANLYMRVTQIYFRVNYTAPSGTYDVNVDYGQIPARGIIDSLSSDARFGLAYYNYGAGIEAGYANGRNDGAGVETYIGFDTPVSMINSIGNLTASTWTPLAESLYEMIQYFRQEPPAYTGNSPADYQTGQAYDPYYFSYPNNSGRTSQYVPCAKSFILFLTDGESTKDENIPAWLRDYDGDNRDPGTYPSDGTDYMDDVALWGRTVDHRSTLTGNQNVITYPVFMFGRGSQLLKDAAINGGFNDLNGDNRPGPDIREYLRDSDEDGAITNNDLPLTYFEGDDGYALEASITQAIADIMKRAASGTAVSVLTTSSRGVGSIVQAYFLPIRQDGMREISWTGYAQNIWLDPFDNLREDTVNDLVLKLA
ncbi:MAG TPA: hypothetical protein VN604_11260, partial [Nitrospirota bacterium]|nr:hypothetical protein [Nitrospirota bacterium]